MVNALMLRSKQHKEVRGGVGKKVERYNFPLKTPLLDIPPPFLFLPQLHLTSSFLS